MRHLLLVLGLAPACAEPVDFGEPAFESGPVTCSPRLDRYPVAGPHNGGYDNDALHYTCPPHPGSSPDNTDYGGDH